MNDTLVIIYRSLMVGGIERYVVQLMERAILQKKKIIWICHKEKRISPVYDYLFESPFITIVPTNMDGLGELSLPFFEVKSNEMLTVLTFSVFHLYLGFEIRKEHPLNKVKVFYLIPHFTGGTIFPELNFPWPLKRCVQLFFSNIYTKALKSQSLLFFSERHYKELYRHYNILVTNGQDYLVKPLFKRPSFDTESVRKRFHKPYFTIVSAGRFEFPHKGYIFGLVKLYAQLKSTYTKLRLLIIGDGEQKQELLDVINRLPDEIKKDIIIHEPVSYEKLLEIFQECNMCISVAGCVSAAAKVGLISLPARHYTYECEVYGYYPQCKSLTLSSDKGNSAQKYIEQVLSMDENTYVQYSLESYNSFEDEEIDVNFPFNLANDTSYSASTAEIISVKLIRVLQKLLYHIHI